MNSQPSQFPAHAKYWSPGRTLLASAMPFLNILIIFSSVLGTSLNRFEYFVAVEPIHPPLIDGTPEAKPTKEEPPQIIGTPVPAGSFGHEDSGSLPYGSRLTWFETRPTQEPDQAAPAQVDAERDAEVLPTQTPEAPVPVSILATQAPGGVIPTVTAEAVQP